MPQTQRKKLHSDPQLSLALAPPRIQDRLRDAHNHPLAGFKDGGGMVSHRVPPSELWGYPFVEISQTFTSYCALVFDCDDPEAAELAFYDGAFPRPSWTVENLETRHLHVGYGLVLPVHRYEAAKRKPLQTLRRVAEYGTLTLNADPGFSGVLTRNPEPRNPIPNYGERTRTRWGRKRLFWLSDFGLYIPKSWRAPRQGQATTGIGRNVDLFRDCLAWAGRRENENKAVLDYALERAIEVRERYAKIADHVFPAREVEGIAASVERYREQWAAGEWHSPRFIARKKAQGKRGGAASGKVRRRRTEIRDTMILAWWRAGHTQQAIADFFQLTQVRVCQILKRDKDLPTPKVLHPLPRLWKADPLAPDFGGVIEPRKLPRPEPENPVQFDPEPIQTSLLPST